MISFKVVILGSNSAIPIIKRNPSSQLVIHNEKYFLVDCGEGTQVQLRKLKYKFQRINHIFISHLHGDHYFGLIGLINSMHLMGRQNELNLFAPPLLERIIDLQLQASNTILRFPLVFHPINSNQNEIIYSNDRLTVSTIPLDHRIPTCGFLFKEKESEHTIKKDFVKNHCLKINDIIQIKHGFDYQDEGGKTYKNSEITNPIPPKRSYAYCSDTGYSEKIIPIIKNVNLLYHETTFMKDMTHVAREKFHSTTVDAANIALKSKAKKLLIGHFSTRYKNTILLENESKSIFPNTTAIKDGDEISIL